MIFAACTQTTEEKSQKDQETLDETKLSGLTKEDLQEFYSEMDRAFEINCEIKQIVFEGTKAEKENDTSFDQKAAGEKLDTLIEERKQITKKWNKKLDYNEFYISKTIQYIEKMLKECKYITREDIEKYNNKLNKLNEELEELKKQQK